MEYTNDQEAMRRNMLGDLAADMIDKIALTLEADPAYVEQMETFIESASTVELAMFNLADILMQIAIAENEPRLSYASIAVLMTSGGMFDDFDNYTWSELMDHAETVWASWEEAVADIATEGFTS
jgi:hypothetical protein